MQPCKFNLIGAVVLLTDALSVSSRHYARLVELVEEHGGDLRNVLLVSSEIDTLYYMCNSFGCVVFSVSCLFCTEIE